MTIHDDVTPELLPPEPYRAEFLPGIQGSDSIWPPFARAMDEPHFGHLSDEIGYMRPSLCPTCRKAYEALQEVYSALPDLQP